MISQEHIVTGLVGSLFIMLVVIVSVSIMPGRQIIQPIEFNHMKHFEYFREGIHRQTYFDMHEDILGEVPGELANGDCLDCHGSFDEAAEDIPRIKACAGCHEIFLNYEIRSRPEIRPCIGCHRTVPYSYSASIPQTEICVSCHDKPRTQSLEEQKLIEYIKNGKEIPWIRVYDYLPGDIVFSHERHVMLGELDCKCCHGDVEKSSRPLTRILELSMEDCIECHESMLADNDCLACHK